MTPSGQTKHPGQTCPNSKEKSLDTGHKRGSRNKKAQKAVKNALEKKLIGEMYKMIMSTEPRGTLRGHLAGTATRGNSRGGRQ